ncbi:HAD superfamily hydrolase [Fructilactobacillus fructivorans]|uniref:Cof-type HAD-IIB family hydrolase n=1 Tax=Fructilactobacillus fructivorans TaxID=1614 RepID=UPI000704977F|nr:Cof-type HAD-IIB family hydrolase [Fructilactobacillus fructivorans]KRN12381.1 HAD superfamily hydrolase [Fructilactobacillus fructivorans]
MIKMIALDLDNTLLTSDKKISKVNEAELKKLHQQGIKVVLCTGRPINAIWKYIKQLGLDDPDDYTITFNGGLVVRNTDKHELFKRGMNRDAFKPLYEYAKKNDFPLDILDFTQVYPISDFKPSIYQQMLNADMQFVPTKFSEMPDESYSKAVIAAEPDVLDRAVKDMPATVRDHYHIVRSQPKILEFLAPNVDKAYGLGALLSHYGDDFSNLMAFGDAENDAGMIKKAQVGVAMANAQEPIKKIATDVTTSNDDDGVAAFLQKYFKVK